MATRRFVGKTEMRIGRFGIFRPGEIYDVPDIVLRQLGDLFQIPCESRPKKRTPKKEPPEAVPEPFEDSIPKQNEGGEQIDG